MKIRNVSGRPRAVGNQTAEPRAEIDVDDVLGAQLLEQPRNWATAQVQKTDKAATGGKED